MSADAYRKCLRALMATSAEHDTPTGRAVIASAYSAFCAFLVAEDPEAMDAILSSPFEPFKASNPGRSSCGPNRTWTPAKPRVR